MCSILNQIMQWTLFFLNNIDMYIYIPSLKPSQSASKTNKQQLTQFTECCNSLILFSPVLLDASKPAVLRITV